MGLRPRELERDFLQLGFFGCAVRIWKGSSKMCLFFAVCGAFAPFCKPQQGLTAASALACGDPGVCSSLTS